MDWRFVFGGCRRSSLLKLGPLSVKACGHLAKERVKLDVMPSRGFTGNREDYGNMS